MVRGLSPLVRYTTALACAVLGVAVRLSLEPLWQGRLPYITLFPAIVVSAWVGGFGPGLLTTLLTAAGAAYFWIPPYRSFAVSDPNEWVGLSVFVVVGAVISGLNEAWRRETEALSDSEQRLGVTLASIGDAVLTTDDEGRVTSMNEIAEQLTGRRASDAIGRPIEDVLVLEPEQPGGIVVNPVRQVLRDGHAVNLAVYTLLVARDGRRIPIDDSASPIRADGGSIGGVVLVFRDVSERRAMDRERELQDRTARELASIVETSDDAIVSKDLESTVRSWNRGAERIFGYTAEEMIGQSIRTIIPKERWGEEDDVLRQLRQGLRVDHFETIRCRKDGTLVHVSLTISPIYSPAGIVIGASKIARDITERRQAESERALLLKREQEARADVERAGRLKDDFLAVLSHELRTPLNAVMGYTQLLISGVMPAENTMHALQAIQRNAQAQARLVESLIDLSRVLAGKLELDVEDLDLSSIVANAVDVLRPEALKKRIALDVVDAGGILLPGDSARLQQVFGNLLSNAIKFTGEGGRVTVETATDDDSAIVRVADNGRGIAPDLLPHVFDRFKQGDAGSARAQMGLGLGLALVRELVNAHGGTVTAASEGEGRGATFTVRLPLLGAPHAGTPGIVRSIRRQETDLSAVAPDVLIVDDEPDARDMLAIMIETHGGRPRVAGSAAEAFEAMAATQPDVLLADVGMAVEDGYSLIRRWRFKEQEEHRPRTPAIAVTAFASPSDRDRALKAGYDWHIAKPVDADELMRIIAVMTRPGEMK